MSRSRRPWSVLRDQIKSTVQPGYVPGTPTGQQGAFDPFWTDFHILGRFNICKDHRELQLNNLYEGFGVGTYLTNLVAGQAYYTILDPVLTVKRAIRVFSDGREEPMDRADLMGEGIVTQAIPTGLLYKPTYSLVDNYIRLDPPPGGTEVNALKLEFVIASDFIQGDGDLIPDSWPPQTESLLILDTAIDLLDSEEAQEMQKDRAPAFVRRRDRLEAEWQESVETRAWGREFAVPFRIGT